jgi:hypothetical protein
MRYSQILAIFIKFQGKEVITFAQETLALDMSEYI